MYRPLPTPEEMARWDSTAQRDYGLLQELLMENAAREALGVLLREFGPVEGKQVVLLAGPGNNGGDAFALARYLADHGARVSTFHVKPPEAYTGAAAYHLDLLNKLRLPLVPLPDAHIDHLRRPDILVDGLLGTGFQGELRTEYRQWIEYINRLPKEVFVLSLDIPTGLNGLTGRPSPIAVKASATVSFEATKLGPALPEAAPYVGRERARPIGIPFRVKQAQPPGQFLLERDVLNLLPPSEDLLHKGTAGHVLVVGGSPGLTGAPLLSALAALRCGAGLSSVACPAELASEIKAGCPEVMLLPLGRGTSWSRDCVDDLSEALARFNSLILGPGLGRSPEAAAFCQALLALDLPPLVGDADFLYALAQNQDLFTQLPLNSILTPHPGEMAMLSGLSIEQVQANRIETAREYARKWNVILVLKGAGTVIASGEGAVYVSPFACPNLAVGGSGDVLCGVLGALLATGLDPLSAANAGVYWHGLAGMELRKRFPRRGNLAREIADMLPHVVA
ncbi:bifunctional ADP-dependent NAD(P)H-hydrate dehydratase/NAD(P)H-hydrate epimerase [Desulfonatronum thiodismutans]|uniref:bifunctional ADP-dependent NAD(P)H-hydrate dehydratase/NAD(P)H-hydrate epimerase n=1 Tax=Desulfonatronum thiodismutans TaxID=159290 RepID=UPI0004ABE7E2|nr:bifunctional ADP-dependent NAD(P)H-hydrate dehydratase/NAD(P)H-hydrate epimerase [Desulfonatronum thiodismutans]